jgi:aspartyl protease family protein
MSTGMTVLAWIVFMVLMGFFFSELLGKQSNPNQALSTRYNEDRIREVSLARNRAGHYVTSGQVNGRNVVFILDTGATGVAIPVHIAEKLGIQPGRAFQVQTANGVGVSYAARLDTVSVGEISLEDVQAGIVPGLSGDEILLGMSFLRHIEFTQRGNELILRQGF